MTLPGIPGLGVGYYVPEDEQQQQAMRERMLEVRLKNRELVMETFQAKVVGFWTTWTPKMRRELVYLKHLPIFMARTTIEEWLKAFHAKSQREAYMARFQPTLLAMLEMAQPQEPEPVEEPQENIQLQMQYATQLAEYEKELERVARGELRMSDVLMPWWRTMYSFDPKDCARMMRDLKDHSL